jgi:hypothetical protein
VADDLLNAFGQLPMARKLMLIMTVGLALIVMALLVDNRRQGRLIRERYAQLVTALERGDTNAIQNVVVGNIYPSYLNAVVKRPWQADETPGTLLIYGSSAVFWPHGKGQRGFPIGDVIDWTRSNGVWYVSAAGLD